VHTVIRPIVCESRTKIKSDAPVVVPFLAKGVIDDKESAAWGHGVREKVVGLAM
jgi:hypothetical protein